MNTVYNVCLILSEVETAHTDKQDEKLLANTSPKTSNMTTR